MSKLLQDGPASAFEGVPIEEVRAPPPPDYAGFEVIADMRVFDFRPWKAAFGTSAGGLDERSWAYVFRRNRLQRKEPAATRFAVLLRTKAARIDVRPRNDRIPMFVRLLRDVSADKHKPMHHFEIAFDLSTAPLNEVTDLAFELLIRDSRPVGLPSVGPTLRGPETGMLSYWLIMPDDQHYKTFDLVRFPTEKSAAPEPVAPAYQLNLADGQALAFSLLSAEPGFTYECRWIYPEYWGAAMRGIYRFLTSTVLGGLVVLLPLIALGAIVVWAVGIAFKVMVPVFAWLPDKSVGGVSLTVLAAIGALVGGCFVAGLLAETAILQGLRERAERYASFIPGYAIMKNVGANLVGIEGKDPVKTVAVRLEASHMLGFLMETLADGRHVVFVPGVPRALVGTLHIVDADRVQLLAIPVSTALDVLSRLGTGLRQCWPTEPTAAGA